MLNGSPSRRLRLTLLCLLVFGLMMPPPGASAQTPAPQDTPAKPPAQPEIELNLENLPTTRPLDRHESYFRVTHRFSRDLRRGDFGSLLEDFFSLDNGAVIGLEYRFGLTSDAQLGVHRTTLSKTIQFFGKYDRWRQSEGLPVSISAVASVEGLDNFQDDYQPAFGASISRVVGPALALYATPLVVFRTHSADSLGEEDDQEDQHTMLLGLGTRVRLRRGLFVAAEYSPRVAGHDPGNAVWGAGIEFWTGKHSFQINFTNGFGTTFGQLARGGSDHDVYLGFNITRRF